MPWEGNEMLRQRYPWIVLLVVALNACATPMVKQDGIALIGRNLTIKTEIKDGTVVHLFHVLKTTDRRSSYRRNTDRVFFNFVRYVPPVYLTTRPGSVTIDRGPVATVRVRDGSLSFDLPSSIDEQERCFLLASKEVDGRLYGFPGGKDGIRRGGLQFLNLSAVAPYNRAAEHLEEATRSAQRARAKAQAKELEISHAGGRLETNVAFAGRQCHVPSKRPYPARPENAISPAEVKEKARGIYAQHIVGKYGCSIGVFFATAANRKSKGWEKFHSLGNGICDVISLAQILGSAFSGKSASEYIPRDGSTTIVDLVELGLSTCVGENNTACNIAFGTMLAVRAATDIPKVEQKLLQPYSRWQTEIRRIDSEPGKAYNQCRSDLGLVAQKSVINNQNQMQIAKADRSVQVARASLSALGQQTHKGSELICRADIDDYF